MGAPAHARYTTHPTKWQKWTVRKTNRGTAQTWQTQLGLVLWVSIISPIFVEIHSNGRLRTNNSALFPAFGLPTTYCICLFSTELETGLFNITGHNAGRFGPFVGQSGFSGQPLQHQFPPAAYRLCHFRVCRTLIFGEALSHYRGGIVIPHAYGFYRLPLDFFTLRWMP